MERLVVYESSFGSTQAYAEMIGKRLDAPIKKMSQTDTADIDAVQLIIIGTCLLGGELLDYEKIRQFFTTYPNKQWILFTVGLSNPAFTNFEQLFKNLFEESLPEKLTVFHFRGQIRYKRLSFMYQRTHKAETMRTSVDTLPLDEHEKELIEREGTTVDTADFEDIQPLITFVHNLGAKDYHKEDI